MNTLGLLFSWFIVATVRGSLLALAVLSIQAALRGRLPANWRYAIWLPVMFVLISPCLPQSRWSVESRFVFNTGKVLRIEAQSGRDNGRPIEAPAPRVESSSAAVTGWRSAAPAIWLAGTAGMLCLGLATYARTLRGIRRHAVPPNSALTELVSETILASGLGRAPRLLVSTAVRSPAVTGLIRPLLLLPAEFPGTLTREEAGLVLLHELVHIKRQDLPLNWLLCLVQAIHWCNPLLWFVFMRIRSDREAACDAQVLSARGGECRADYGHALLKLEGWPAPSGWSLGFLGIFEHAAGLRSRIRAVAAYRRPHPAWTVAGIAMIAVLTIAGGTRAQEAATNKPVESIATGGQDAAAAPIEQITRKLETIVLARLEFRDVSIREALEFLRIKSIELDTSEPNPAKRGVNIVLRLKDARAAVADSAGTVKQNADDVRISAALVNISLKEALKHVLTKANLKMQVEPYAVMVMSMDESTDKLITREWKVNAAILAALGQKAGQGAKEFLAAKGVTFPEGASAVLLPERNRLVMRNTQANLALVNAMVEKAQPPPK